jgi:Rad3-related DNA helicase
LHLQERESAELGLDASALAPWIARIGPVAVVDLETTGLADDPEAEILEIGAVLLDPGLERIRTAHTLIHPRGALPPAVQRLTGLSSADVADAPPIAAVADAVLTLLHERVLVAHNAPFEQYFLTRFVAPSFAHANYLDTLDLLALTHPDTPDLRLESFTRLLLGAEEHHRAMRDALDTARVLSGVARGARAGGARYRTARRAFETFAPDAAWLALLGKSELAPPTPPPLHYVEIGPSSEPPVPFEEEAIVRALADEARGRRHFPGYRVRTEQIRLARRFSRTLAEGGAILLEGGTGVGKSLAYLAAAIPFAVGRAGEGQRGPVLISTRTKLLQDQLLAKDIQASARMLGYPELRALSIKGRANYVCARRLEPVLAEGREPRIFREDRLAYAALYACARTRPNAEIGTLPAALLRRFPLLRELLRRSVASRPEQCSRDQCASEPSCPLGRRRAALAEAHLVVANHDLLLRWPPDYPRFSHVIADEVHELADVADEVYALEVSPQEILDRLDEIFGRPGDRSRGDALLPARARRGVSRDAVAWRRAIQQDLVTLGRQLAGLAEFGEVDVPAMPGPRFEQIAALARIASQRLDAVCGAMEPIVASVADGREGGGALQRSLEDLRAAAAGLRLPFEAASAEQVAAFEGLDTPFDRWRLVVRAVDPSDAFHRTFLQGLESFAGVSASLFVGGDAFAALGELDIEERLGDLLERDSVPSPFPYADHMRVLALESRGDLVEETTEVLADLARRLRGRTLGLFTSLRRMNEVAERLALRLRHEGIDVLSPRRASDDPTALVRRFCQGDAVLLGSRKFWQGLDIPGARLQAVVIEKLPFEVPTELRRRRERRLKARGEDSFGRYTLGKMLLNLKQMTGRLIRTEEDRGIVVLVEGRTDRRYFPRVDEALPPGVSVTVGGAGTLQRLLGQVGIGDDAGHRQGRGE